MIALVAAPAIVRASSLDSVLRGVVLEPTVTELDWTYREITLGYTITRQAIENEMYGMALARLKAEGELVEYDGWQEV